jgi:hypothetical protein
MRPGVWNRKLLSILLVAFGLVTSGMGGPTSRGDEPSRFSRLFRLGNTSTSPAAAHPPASPTGTPPLLPPPSTYSSPTPPQSSSSPRILPQPRNSKPVTESDPIVTRVAVNRTSDGTIFCDFLMVYADGTILDGAGVHHVGRETLKPLVDAMHTGDVFRIRGHCGGPPTDYIEQVHVVVYERSLGRLRAHSFSYSGNTEGCDHTIKHIQAALESIQTKISGPMTLPPTTDGPVTTPAPSVPITPSPSTGRSIPLTPLN